MRTLFIFVLTVSGSLMFQSAFSQGWVAEVEININHGLYAFERLNNATVSMSGATISGSSSTSIVRLVLKGSGTPIGNIQIVASGAAWEPYNPDDLYSTTINATYSGSFELDCTTRYFDSYDGNNPQHISGSVKVFPRLEISEFSQKCDNVSLTSNTCSLSFLWEISESMSGIYKMLPGKSSSTIILTRKELYDVGLSSQYGRKYFRVTGQSGTTSQIQVVDIVYPGPTASITSIPPKCHDGMDGEMNINISSPFPSGIDDYVVTLVNNDGKTNPLQFILNNTSFLNIPNLAAANYSINISNNSNKDLYGNCWIDYQAVLINPNEIIIPSFEISDFNGYGIKCKGECNGTIQAYPSGGTGIYPAFVWIPDVSTGNIADDLTEGTYKIKVQDSNNCWSGEHSKTLNAPEPLAIELESTGGKGGFDISCIDKMDGAIIPIISGGVKNYSFSWSDGSTNETLSGLGLGTYSLTISDKNGCSRLNSINLIAPAPISFEIKEISEIKCPGDATGSLEVQSTSNTIGQTSYSWSSGETVKSISNKPAGDYMVTIFDDQGCSATKSKTLKEPIPYTVDIVTTSSYNGSVIRCHGEANGKLTTIVKGADTNITAGEYYTWFKNGSEFISGPNQTSLDNLARGMYKVEIQYRTICKVEKTFTLDEPTPIQAQIVSVTNYNGFPISCHGASDGSISASAVGGTGSQYAYSWNSGDTVAMISKQKAGKYIVTSVDINGCKGTAEKTLEEPDPVKSDISILSDFSKQAISCTDASDGWLQASAFGGVGTFHFSWSNGQIGRDIKNIKAGTYTLTTIDLNGCTSVTDTTIKNPDPVNAVISTTSDYHGFGVSCKGSKDGFIAMKATGGTGVFEFSWNGGWYSGSLIENLPSGEYNVVASDENGCSTKAFSLITEPPVLTLKVLNYKDVSCHNGKDGEIYMSANGGAGSYQFSVDEIHYQNSQSLTELPEGMYEIDVKDTNGCHFKKDQTLMQPPKLYINFQNIKPSFCNKASGEALAVVSGGTGTHRYEWRDSEKNVLSNKSIITEITSGIYSVLITDENNCEARNSVGISSVDGPKVRVSDIIPATCSYSQDGSARFEIAEGGASPYTIRWPDGQTTVEGIHLAKGNYLVEITDGNNCKVVETVNIAAPDSLLIHLMELIAPACHSDCNGKIKILATGGTGQYNFYWGNDNGAELNNVCAGNYDVKVFDQQGCHAEKSFLILEPASIEVKLRSSKIPDCHDGCDGSLEIETSGGAGSLKYIWSNGETTSEINNLCSGTYSTTVIDQKDCIITKLFTLDPPPPPSLDLGDAVTLCAGQTHYLDPGSHWIDFSWGSNTGFASQTQTVLINTAGMYWLEALDDIGCYARDTFLLQTSLDLLKTNFFLTTEAMANDTVVMIDVSWPLPENSQWKFPEKMEILEDHSDIIYGKFQTPGFYEVSLMATLAECRDEMVKGITILKWSEEEKNGRIGHEPFVKQFNLYPNPNDG
ncbi:MAG: SprB repeat-containing protein, partial [Cyclobacteriaceae bacterium]